MSIIETEKHLSAAHLRDRLAMISEHMQPRTTISDGSQGYRLTATTELTVRVGPDANDENMPIETISFDVRDCEVRVPDPTLTVDGAVRFDIEIYRLYAESVSTVLFGREVPVIMRVGRGLDPMLRATLGRFEVPANVEFGTEPLLSTQWVNLAVETPLGVLQNRQPAVMQARIRQMPPDKAYVQQGLVPMYDSHGNIVAVKCRSSSTDLATA